MTRKGKWQKDQIERWINQPSSLWLEREGMLFFLRENRGAGMVTKVAAMDKEQVYN